MNHAASPRPRRRSVPLLAGVVVAFGAFASPASAEPVVIRIGVSSTSLSDLSRDEWSPLAEWLTARFAEHLAYEGYEGAPPLIEFVTGDMDDHLEKLCVEKTLDGAILAPFRYVLARVARPELDVLVRIRRPTPIYIDPKRADKEPTKEELRAAGTVGATYRSLVLIHQERGEWPPSVKGAKRFAFSSPLSTSEFIYPVAWFRQMGWLADGAAIARAEGRVSLHALESLPHAGDGVVTFDTLLQPWTWRHSATPTPKTDLMARLEYALTPPEDLPADRERAPSPSSGPPFDVIATNDYDVALFASRDSTWEKKYRKVYASRPIPFECVVIDTGKDHVRRVLQALRRTFLDTQGFAPTERDRRLKYGLRDVCEGCGCLVRRPDIFDFIEGKDEDYADVRRAAVLAMGGTVLTVAVSQVAHARAPGDAAAYFSRLQDRLLNAPHASQRVALDLRPYEADRVETIKKDLMEDRLDVAELSGYHASEVLGRERAVLLGCGLFKAVDGTTLEKQHHVYLLQAEPRTTPPAQDRKGDPLVAVALEDDGARFAVTRRTSSSGFIWPAHKIRGTRTLDVEDRCAEFGDAWGVRQALLNYATNGAEPPYATHAFLPDYEYAEVMKAADVTDDPTVPRIARLDSYEVPNLALVVRSGLCPSCRGVVIRDASSGASEDVMFILRDLLPRQSRLGEPEPTHFFGFAPALRSEDKPYTSVYLDRQPNYPLWFGAASLLLVGGSALGVLLARRRTAASAPVEAR